jgi:di/tripeptidase
MATLATRISDLATRIATEVKSLRTLINGNAADLSALTTTAKTNLVAALNEVRALASGNAGAAINDASTATTSVWSSSKVSSQITTQVNALLGASTPAALDTLDELANALGDDANFAGTMTTALANRVRYDAAQTLTAPQKAQAKSNIDAYGNLEIGNPDSDFVATFNAGLV